jgi:hypothetical protein
MKANDRSIWTPWHSKTECRLTRLLRYAAIVGLIANLPRIANSARADGSGAGSGGGTPVGITLSIPYLSIIGGDVETGAKVILSQPAPAGGAKVTVSSDHKVLSIAPLIPKSPTVPAGATSVGFNLVTSTVADETTVAMTASYGSASTVVKITLEPNAVASVIVQPENLDWGASAHGTVQLKSPAPKNVTYYKNTAAKGQPSHYEPTTKNGGATVTLASSLLKTPASVKVPAGTSIAQFSATAPQASSCSMAPASPATGTVTATWQKPASTTVKIGLNSGKPGRYTAQTIRIDPSALLGVSHDAHALLLSNSDKCVASLKTGSIIYFKHLGVLKVVKVKPLTKSQLAGLSTLGGVAVAVSSAALTDFINDGTFQMFSQKLADAPEPSGPWKQGEAADEPQGGDGGWKYKVSGSGTDYSFTAFKENNGLSASVTGHGQMTNVGYNFLAVIHGAKLQQATFTAPLEGTLDVDWGATTTAAGQGIGESRLRLPAMHSGLVDSADDIPLLFQVYANLIFKPGFGEKAAAQGHFKITYKGEGGIDGSSAIDHSLDVTPDISSTTSSAKAPHGAVVAINAPKFALSLSTVSFLWALDARMPGALNAKGADLADSLQSQLGSYVKGDLMPPSTDKLFQVRRAVYVMWVSTVSYAGAGMLAMLPCQQYYQNYLASAGMDKDMLGSISGSIPPENGVDVFKKDGVSAIPSIAGCYPKK